MMAIGVERYEIPLLGIPKDRYHEASPREIDLERGIGGWYRVCPISVLREPALSRVHKGASGAVSGRDA